MSAFLQRASALVAFVAVLWVVQIINWITGCGLNVNRQPIMTPYWSAPLGVDMIMRRF